VLLIITVGTYEGILLGKSDIVWLGSLEIASDGICDGRTEGEVLNVNVGCTEGSLLGSADTV
jgi:hypothetical protein